MKLLDVNVLIYAHRSDAPDHRQYLQWLEDVVNSDEAFGLAELVLSSFLRIVTHPRIFKDPSSLRDALAFVEEIRSPATCTIIVPGRRHWSIFTDLCERAGARGNTIPDAYLAALAIESGSTWMTTDRGFSRFPGLRWIHPLQAG